MTKVLVVYATKMGATAEIARKICEVLVQGGHDVDLVPAGEVENLVAYQAVVLGSAIYYGRWRKEAVKFLLEQEADLQNK